MNKSLFKYEFKRQFKSTIIYSAIIVSVLSLFLVVYYPVLLATKDDLIAVLQEMPEAFLIAFSFDADVIFTYNGILVFGYGFIGIAIGMFSSTLAITIFGREKKNKCMSFLLTKPVCRTRIFLTKLVAAFSLLLLSIGIFVLSSLFLYLINGSGSFNVYLLLIMSFSFLYFVVFSISVLIVTIMKKTKNPGLEALTFVMSIYIISMIVPIIDERLLKMLSPFDFLDPDFLIKKGHYELGIGIWGLVVLVGCIVIAYYWFKRQDIRE